MMLFSASHPLQPGARQWHAGARIGRAPALRQPSGSLNKARTEATALAAEPRRAERKTRRPRPSRSPDGTAPARRSPDGTVPVRRSPDGTGPARRSAAPPAAAERPAKPRLEPGQVEAAPSCQAAVDLVLAQPQDAFSYAALDRAMELLLQRGRPGNPSDLAAASQLASFCWQGIRRLKRWPLLRLLKLAAAFGLATPERMAAWQDVFASSGSLRRLSTSQALDLLEAARVLCKTEAGRAAVAALDPQLLPAALDQAFAADGGAAVAAPAAEQPRAPLPATVSQRKAAASTAAQAATVGAQAASVRHGVEGLSLKKLAMLWHAAAALGLPLSPAQQRRAAGALGDALKRGEWDGARVVMASAAWSNLEAARRGPLEGRDGGVAAGYPGNWVMQEVVQGVHAHRSELTPWELAQFLAALGHLRYRPRSGTLGDLIAALEPSLAGAERWREVSAALPALAKLGADPGESFAAACAAVALADGGRDQQLLCNTAWALAVLGRCTSERWQALVGLLDDGAWEQPGADSRWPGRLRSWALAYLLVREQHGDAHPEQPAAEQPQRAGGVPPPQPAQQQQAGGGTGGGPTELAPLPPAALAAGLAELRAAQAPGALPQPGTTRSEVAEVVRQLGRGSLEVVEHHWVEDPATGAALLVDVAVPQLRLALEVRQLSDYTRCTASPSGNVLARGRLLAHWGWRLVQVPAPAELKAGAERLREAAEARRQQAAARHAGAAAPGQVLQPRPQRKGADSAAAAAQQAAAPQQGQAAPQQGQQEQEQRQEGQQGQREQAGNGAATLERVNLRPAIRAFLLRQPGLRSLLQSSGARQGGGRGRGRQRWTGRSGSRLRSAGAERA